MPGTMRKATDADKLQMFQKYDAFLFDLDGTLWKGSQLIPGAVEFIETLKSYNKKVFYVTNNASKSRRTNSQKLADLGLPVAPGEMYTSSFAAAAYLKGKGFTKKAYVVGEEGLVEELDLAGIRCVGGPEHRGERVDWLAPEPRVELDPEVGAVVVGIDRYINYFKLQYATLALTEDPGCHFVACNTDARGHFSAQQEWAGAGTMVGALKASSEREPVVVGKPSSFILDHVCKAAGLKPEQCIIFGDRLDTDILWGANFGLGTCCVLTGVTSEAQLQQLAADDKMRPMYYLDSIGDIMSVKAQLPPVATCAVQ